MVAPQRRPRSMAMMEPVVNVRFLTATNHSAGNLVGRGESLQRRTFQLLIAPALVHRFYEIGFDQAGRNGHARIPRARARASDLVILSTAAFEAQYITLLPSR